MNCARNGRTLFVVVIVVVVIIIVVVVVVVGQKNHGFIQLI